MLELGFAVAILLIGKGRKSWHITLAIPALIAATAWFLHGGIDLTLPGGYRVFTATSPAMIL